MGQHLFDVGNLRFLKVKKGIELDFRQGYLKVKAVAVDRFEGNLPQGRRGS